MPETDLVFRDGLRFTCTRCSACCRHTPGFVFLSARDLARIARALGVDTAEARRRYCRPVRIGAFIRISLQEKPNLDCILWENGGCSVYASRPLQCRSFPFWGPNLASRESWEEQAAACPGIGKGRLHGRSRIQRWLARRVADPLLGE
jgi:hypothetical protein